MKTSRKSVFLFLPLLVLFVLHPFPTTIAQQDVVSATPTYDPLVEPPLPENPTEYELGRNLYWHWCMTCHGDKGQGLTDEFRSIWDKDHQNCWGRGCHAGHNNDMGFPIPTVVPALVSDSHLAQFASVQALSDFLKATHPPQSPGILKDEEYRAIAIFVFTMNGRSLVTIPVTDTPTPLPTSTIIPSPNGIPHREAVTGSFPIYVIPVFVLIVIGILIFVSRKHLRG
jgi:cytochrome c